VKAIRVIAVGLFASAWVMIHLSIRLFQNSDDWTILHALLRAMRQVDPDLFPGIGLGSIALIALTLVSLSVGLLASVLIYSPIYDFFAWLIFGRLMARMKAPRSDEVHQSPSSRD